MKRNSNQQGGNLPNKGSQNTHSQETKKNKFLISLVLEGVVFAIILVFAINMVTNGGSKVGRTSVNFRDFGYTTQGQTFNYIAKSTVTTLSKDYYCIELQGNLKTGLTTEEPFFDFGISKEALVDVLGNHIKKEKVKIDFNTLTGSYEIAGEEIPNAPISFIQYGSCFTDVADYLLLSRYYTDTGEIGGWALSDFGNANYSLTCTFYVKIN